MPRFFASVRPCEKSSGLPSRSVTRPPASVTTIDAGRLVPDFFAVIGPRRRNQPYQDIALAGRQHRILCLAIHGNWRLVNSQCCVQLADFVGVGMGFLNRSQQSGSSQSASGTKRCSRCHSFLPLKRLRPRALAAHCRDQHPAAIGIGIERLGKLRAAEHASSTWPSRTNASATAYCSRRRKPFVPSMGSSVQNVAGGSPRPRSISPHTSSGVASAIAVRTKSVT